MIGDVDLADGGRVDADVVGVSDGHLVRAAAGGGDVVDRERAVGAALSAERDLDRERCHAGGGLPAVVGDGAALRVTVYVPLSAASHRPPGAASV